MNSLAKNGLLSKRTAKLNWTRESLNFDTIKHIHNDQDLLDWISTLKSGYSIQLFPSKRKTNGSKDYTQWQGNILSSCTIWVTRDVMQIRRMRKISRAGRAEPNYRARDDERMNFLPFLGIFIHIFMFTRIIGYTETKYIPFDQELVHACSFLVFAYQCLCFSFLFRVSFAEDKFHRTADTQLKTDHKIVLIKY